MIAAKRLTDVIKPMMQACSCKMLNRSYSFIVLIESYFDADGIIFTLERSLNDCELIFIKQEDYIKKPAMMLGKLTFLENSKCYDFKKLKLDLSKKIEEIKNVDDIQGDSKNYIIFVIGPHVLSSLTIPAIRIKVDLDIKRYFEMRMFIDPNIARISADDVKANMERISEKIIKNMEDTSNIHFLLK